MNIDNSNQNNEMEVQSSSNSDLNLYDPSGDEMDKAKEQTHDVAELYLKGVSFKQMGALYNDNNHKFILNSKDFNKKKYSDLYKGSDKDWDILQNELNTKYKHLEDGEYGPKPLVGVTEGEMAFQPGTLAYFNQERANRVSEPVAPETKRWGFTHPEAGELRFDPSDIARQKGVVKIYDPDTGDYKTENISRWQYFTEFFNPSTKIVIEQNPVDSEDYTMAIVKPSDMRFHMGDKEQMTVWGAKKKYGTPFIQYPLGILNGLVFETGEAVGRIGQSISSLGAGDVEDPNDLSGFWSGWANMFSGLSYKPTQEVESAGFFGSGAAFGYNMSKLISMLVPQRAAAKVAMGLTQKVASKLALKVGKKAVSRIGRYSSTTVGSTQASSAMFEEGIDNNVNRKTAAWMTLAALPAVAVTEYLIGSKWIAGQLDDNFTQTGIRDAARRSFRKVKDNIPKQSLSKSTRAFNKQFTFEAAKEMSKRVGRGAVKGGKGIGSGIRTGFDIASKAPVTKGAIREGAQEGLEEVYYVGLQAAHDDFWAENEYARPGQGLFGTEWYSSEEWTRIFENALAGGIAGGFADPMFAAMDSGMNKATLDGFLTGFQDGFKRQPLEEYLLDNMQSDEDVRKLFRIGNKMHRTGKFASTMESVMGEKVFNDELDALNGQEIKAEDMEGLDHDFKINNMNDLAFYQFMQNANYILDGMRIAGVTPKNAKEKLKGYNGEEDLFRKAIDLGYRINRANQEHEKLQNEYTEAEKTGDPEVIKGIEEKMQRNRKDVEGMNNLLGYLTNPVEGGMSQAYYDRIFQTFMSQHGKEYTIEELNNLKDNKDFQEFKQNYVNDIKSRRDEIANIDKEIQEHEAEISAIFRDMDAEADGDPAIPSTKSTHEGTGKTYGELRENAAKWVDTLSEKISKSKISRSDLSQKSQEIIDGLALEMKLFDGTAKNYGIDPSHFTNTLQKLNKLGTQFSSIGSQSEKSDQDLARDAEKEFLYGELIQGLKVLNDKINRDEITNDDKLYLEQLLKKKEKTEETIFANNALDHLQKQTGHNYINGDTTDAEGNLIPGSKIDEQTVNDYKEFLANPGVEMSPQLKQLLTPTSSNELLKRGTGIYTFGETGAEGQAPNVTQVSTRKQMPDGRIAQFDVYKDRTEVSFVNKDGSLSDPRTVKSKNTSEDYNPLSNPLENLDNAYKQAQEMEGGETHDAPPYFRFDTIEEAFGKTAESRKIKENARRIAFTIHNVEVMEHIKLIIAEEFYSSLPEDAAQKLEELNDLLIETGNFAEDNILKLTEQQKEDPKKERTIDPSDVDENAILEYEKRRLEAELKLSELFDLMPNKDTFMESIMKYYYKGLGGVVNYNSNYDTRDLTSDEILNINVSDTARMRTSRSPKAKAETNYYLKLVNNLLHRVSSGNIAEFYQLYNEVIEEITDLKFPNYNQRENVMQAFINIVNAKKPYVHRDDVGNFGIITSSTAELIDEKNAQFHNRFPFRGFNFLGYAGTGKTTVMTRILLSILDKYNKIHGKNGVRGTTKDILLVAPSNKMKETLEKQAEGLENISYDIMTYSDYLKRVNEGDIKSGDYGLTAIDESSRITEKELAIIHNRLKDGDNAFLFISDPEQASNNEKDHANYNGTAGQYLVPSDGIVNEIFRTNIVDISLLQNSISKSIAGGKALETKAIDFASTKYNKSHTKGVRYFASQDDVISAWIEDISKADNDANDRVLVFATALEREQFLERNKENPKITSMAGNVRFVNEKGAETDSETIQGEEMPYIYAAVTEGSTHEAKRVYKTATSRAEKFVATVGPSSKSELKPDDEILDLSNKKETAEEIAEQSKINNAMKAAASELGDIASSFKKPDKKKESTKERKKQTSETKTKTSKAIVSTSLDGQEYMGFSKISFDLFSKKNFEPQTSSLDKKNFIGKTITYDGRDYNVIGIQRMKNKGAKGTPIGKLKKVYILQEVGITDESGIKLLSSSKIRKGHIKDNAPISEDPTNNEIKKENNKPPVKYQDETEREILTSANLFSKGRLRSIPLVQPIQSDAKRQLSSDELFNAENIANSIRKINSSDELSIRYFETTPQEVYIRQEDGSYALQYEQDVLALVNEDGEIVSYLFNPDNIPDQVSEEFMGNPVVNKYYQGLKKIKSDLQSGKEINISGKSELINGGYAIYSNNTDEEIGLDALKNKLRKQGIKISTLKEGFVNDPASSDIEIYSDKINDQVYYYLLGKYNGLSKSFRIYLKNDLLKNHKDLQKKLSNSLSDIESTLKKFKKIDLSSFLKSLSDKDNKLNVFNQFFEQNKSIFTIDVNGQKQIKKDWKDLLYIEGENVKIRFAKDSSSVDIWANDVIKRLTQIAKYIDQHGYAPMVKSKEGNFIVGSHIKSDLKDVMMPQASVRYDPTYTDEVVTANNVQENISEDDNTPIDDTGDDVAFFDEAKHFVKQSDHSDISDEKAYLRKLLGDEIVDNNVGFEVYQDDNIWGYVHGLNLILKSTEKGTTVKGVATHEAVHFTLRNMMTETSRLDILSDTKKHIERQGKYKSKDISDKYAEEWLAEAARGKNKVKSNYTGLRGKLKQFVDWISDLFFNVEVFGNEAFQYLNDLHNGKFRDGDIMTQNYGNETVYLTEETSIEESESLFEETNNAELIRWFGEGKFYAKIKRVVSDAMIKTSIFSGKITNDLGKQKLRQLSETTDIIQRIYGSKLDGVNTDQFNSFKSFSEAYNKLGREGLPQYYYWLLSQPNMLNLVIEDIIQRYDKSEEGVNKAQKTFNDKNSISIEQYSSQQMKLFLKTIPKAKPVTKGIGGVDVEYVSDENEPFLNYSKLNQILHDFMLQVERDASIEDIMHEMYDFVANNITGGEVSTQDAETVQYLASFLKRMGFLDTPKDSVKQSRRQGKTYRKYSPYSFVYDLNEIAEYENIDLRDSSDPIRNKLLEIARHHGAMLTSIFQHYNNQQTIKFVTITKKGENSKTEYGRNVRLSSSQNENYNQLRQSIQKNLYGEDSETLKDSFLQQLNEKDDKGNVTSYYNIDKSTGDVSVQDPKSRNKRMVVLKFDKKTNSYSFVEDVDQNIIRKLASFMGMNLSRAQVGYIYEGKQKAGFANRSNFDHKRFANMLGHMFQAAYLSKQEKKISFDSGDMLSRFLSGYLKNQMKLLDTDGVKINDFIDDLKDMGFKLGEVNAMLTNLFTKNAKGDKRYTITQANEISKMIDGDRRRPSELLQRKYLQIARKIAETNSQGHYFITPKGKQLDPFLQDMFSFMDYEVMLMMTDGFTSKDYKNLDSAEILKAEMDVFFESALKGYKYNKVRMGLNSWGESHTKPFVEVAFDGLFHTSTNSKGHKEISFSHKKAREAFTIYFDKMMHESWTSLNKMKKLILDTQNQQQAKDTKRTSDYNQMEKYLKDIENAINRKGLSYTPSLKKANDLMYEYLNKIYINSKNEAGLLQYLSRSGLIQDIDFRYGQDEDGKKSLRTTVGFHDDIINTNNMERLYEAKTDKQVREFFDRIFKNRAFDLVSKANEMGMGLPQILGGETNYQRVFNEDKSINDMMMTYLTASYMVGESFDTLFAAHHKQEKDHTSFFKRMKKNDSSGHKLLTVDQENPVGYGLPRYSNTLRILDTTGQFKELLQVFSNLNTEYVATDGAFIENPILARQRANSVGDMLSIVDMHDKTSKTIDTGIDEDNGLGVMNKNAGFVPSQDMMAFYPKFDQLMKLMLTGGKSIPGVDQNILYDRYRDSLREGKTFDEAMDDVYREIIAARYVGAGENTDNIDLSDLMISRIEHLSGIKLPHGGQNYMNFDQVMEKYESGNFSDVIKSRTDNRNTRVILSHNMDLRKTDVTMLSQALSALAMDMSKAGYGHEAQEAVRQITRDAFSKIDEKYSDNFEKEYRNDAVKGMRSYKDASSLMAKVASENTSIHIPTFIGKTLPSFMKNYKKAINFKTNGWKLVQAPAFMMRQYKLQDNMGNTYYGSYQEAQEYATMNGIDINQLEEKGIESYRFKKVDGKWQISKPEDVIMRLPNMEALGIDPNDRVSLNELLTLQLNGKSINVRQFVKNKSKDYYMDMTDGIEALIELLTDARLDALSEDGKQIDMSTFLGNNYFTKAIRNLYKNETDKEKYVENVQNMITDPEEIANWFEKLLKSTLVTTTRIPTNNWAANGVGEIVGLSYDSGSVIYRSAERTVLDDSDFDIDQLTALFQNFTSLEDTNMQTENNLKNRIQDNFYKSLMDPDNIALTTMQMDLDNFKKLVAKVRGRRKYYFNHPATNAEITHAALTGERMVGYVANGLNVFQRIMSMDPNKRAELIKMDNISSADKSVFIDRFRVFSELLQTALDNQNDPIIQFFGLNPVTSNIITAMAIEGKTTEEIYKMLQNEEVSKLINEAIRSRRIMNKTADISDHVEAELAKYERYMSEEGEKTFIENWIKNFKEKREEALNTYYSLSEDVELAKEGGIKENTAEAKKALNRFLRNNKELEKEYTEADINEMAENEYDKLYEKKDTLTEFNNYIKKGEFIGRLSTFSLHQGYDPKQADIYMKNMMYMDFTGEQITDYNNRDAKKVQPIEEKFKDKEGYNLHKRGDERIRSYRDAHTKMSLINTSINRVGIQGVINRNDMSEAPANFTFVTNGQHGIDSLIGFTPEYNGRKTKVKHVVPEKIFDNKGKRIKGKEFAESLQNEAENISAEATNMRAKEVMESNVKNSNGVIVFTNGNQLTWEGKEMKRLANKYGVPKKYIDINWDIEKIREKFGKSLVEIHIATEDKLREAGKEPMGLKDINVVVTGANSNTLMYESETPFETALRREMEIREIGNIKNILHQIPSLDLYMNGYVKANQMLSKNLLPFTKMVNDIAHESFLKRIGQSRFRSKKQYYAFMDAFNAVILNEHYQENRVKINLHNLSDYITDDLQSLRISIDGVRTLDLGNYWDANIFSNQFPEIGDALKFNPEFKHNYFIQSLSIQNGKLVVKGAMSMNDGEINRVMMDAMEIKKSHPELYDAFKNYTFIANGISASGNSLITFLDESVYKEISIQYDRMMTYAQTYEADPNRTLFDIRVPLIDKINNTDFPSLVVAYNEDAAIYHNRAMQEAGYNPDIVRKTFYQRDHMGDVLFQYMAPYKLNEKTGQYEKMNSKLSKKVKLLPLGKYEEGLTPHEVVRPENAEQMLHFENGSTVTIKKSKHGYQTTNGYFLNRPANIQVAGTKIKVSSKESKRQDSRYVSSEHQSARSFQKTAASNFIGRLANINGIQDNVTIVTNKTSMHPETLSYIENGVIYFNVENMRNDTLVHEFGHILMDVGLKANENTGIYKAANRLYDFAKKALDNQEPIAMKVMNKYPELSGVDLIKEIAVTTLGFRAADGTAALINGLGQQETGRLINETAKFESTFSDEMSLAQPLTGFSLDNITLSSSMDDIINGLISDLITGKFGNNREVRNYLSEVRGLNMENSLTELDATRKSNDLSDVTEQVEELFDSNPELANQVYEALGFKQDLSKSKQKDATRFAKKDKRNIRALSAINKWKEKNGVNYNPQEIYSRNQKIYSEIGRFKINNLEEYLQNLLTNIKWNENNNHPIQISAYTGSPKGLKTTGIRFEINPDSQDILWASSIDVASSRVQNATKDLSKHPISFTKAPKTEHLDKIEPNLSNIITKQTSKNNELAINLRLGNFKLVYDESVPANIKNLIDEINRKLTYIEPTLSNTNIAPNNNSRNNITDIYNELNDVSVDKSIERYTSVYQITPQQKQQAQRAYAQYINDESNLKKHLNDLSPELQKLMEPKKTEYDREISFVDLFETKGFDQKVLKKELEPHIMPVLKNHLINMINEAIMESGDIGLISFISQVKESESFADLPNNVSYKAKRFMQEKNINIDETFVKNVLLINLDKLPLDVLFKNDIYKKDGKYYATTKSFKSSGLSTGNYTKKVSSWHRLKSYPRGQYDATVKATFKPNQVGLGKYHQTDMLDPLSNNEKTMYVPEFMSDQDVEIDLESTVKFNKDLQLDQNTLDPFIDRNKYMSHVDNPGITNDYFGDKRLFEEAEQYFNNNVGMQKMDTSNMNFDSFKKYLANKNIQASKNLSDYEIGLLETDAFKSIIDNDTPVIPSIENGIRILNIGDNEIPTQYFSNIAGMENNYTYIKGTFDNIIDQVIQNEVENGNVIIYC